MNHGKDKVECKGTTTGYGEMKDGEFKGETLLVERAFGDALSKVSTEINCYNTTLAKRVSPQEIQAQLSRIARVESKQDTFKNEFQNELDGISLMQTCAAGDVNQAGGALGSGSSQNADITGYFDHKGNFIALSPEIKDNGCAYGSGTTVVGQITENGDFIATGTSITSKPQQLEVQGYIDEKGNFVAISNQISDEGCAYGKGTRVIGQIKEDGGFLATGGYYREGKFVKGPKTYIDDKGNIIKIAVISPLETGGVSGNSSVEHTS